MSTPLIASDYVILKNRKQPAKKVKSISRYFEASTAHRPDVRHANTRAGLLMDLITPFKLTQACCRRSISHLPSFPVLNDSTNIFHHVEIMHTASHVTLTSHHAYTRWCKRKPASTPEVSLTHPVEPLPRASLPAFPLSTTKSFPLGFKDVWFAEILTPPHPHIIRRISGLLWRTI